MGNAVSVWNAFRGSFTIRFYIGIVPTCCLLCDLSAYSAPLDYFYSRQNSKICNIAVQDKSYTYIVLYNYEKYANPSYHQKQRDYWT